MIRQRFAQGITNSKLYLTGGLIALFALGTFAWAPAAPPRDDVPPRILKFTKDKARGDEPVPKHGYFTSNYLTKEPESRNRGAFACTNTTGTATYLEDNKESYHRVTKFKETKTAEGNITYYIYEEPKVGDQVRTWAFEAEPNPKNNCAIYYQINGGPFILFQVSEKVPFKAVPPIPPFAAVDTAKGSK
jgi:hypothetical protein